MQSMLDDPFFAMHRQQMQRMNAMFHDPFGGMMGSPFMALPEGNSGQQRDRQRRGERRDQLMPADPFGNRGMFDNMFGNMHRMMNDMMSNMHSQMNQIHTAEPTDGQFFSHSSVMSYSNDGSGRPKVYQATSSTTQAPGGLKETRKTLRDSERGIDKMSLGHHIRDRAYVQTKERNRAGDMNEEEELINLDDSEKDSFEHEWRERTRPYSARHRAVAGGRAAARGHAAHGGDRPEMGYRPSALEGIPPRRSKRPAKMQVNGESLRSKQK